MNVAISQALATGLPAIVTRHSGFPEQVIDGENGYLAEEGSPEDIAEKILKYMDHPELWPSMSRKAREHVLAHYDNKELIGRQLSCYKELISKP